MNAVLQALQQRFIEPLKRDLRRAAIASAFLMAASLFLILTLVFCCFAAYTKLSETEDPAIAALIVGGGLLGIAIILVVIALLVLKQKPTSAKARAPRAATSPANAPSTAAPAGPAFVPIRTGHPLIDLAQYAFPLVKPLSQQLQAKVKTDPLPTILATLAAGLVSGFIMLKRQDIPRAISKPKDR